LEELEIVGEVGWVGNKSAFIFYHSSVDRFKS
jgi:hypothetical protein